MPAEITVLKPGLFSSLQDLGRTEYLEYGVPFSGVMDSYAAKMANLSLQNPADAAVLEITQSGPNLQFSAETEIALFGADLSPAVNSVNIENNKIHVLRAGDVLSFGGRKSGCRTYLAISGGFLSEKVLGSRSWFKGITPALKVEKGMKLHYLEKKTRNSTVNAGLKFSDAYLKSEEILVFPGPEFELLSEETKNLLFTTAFHIGPGNRMAIQLKEPLENSLAPIVTGPVLPGTVQLSPSGKMMVLMRDCQTTGGYPRILQLSEKGINGISQKITGEKIRVDFLSK